MDNSPPETQVPKACSPAFGATGRWWNLLEVGPTEGSWPLGCDLRGILGPTLASSPLLANKHPDGSSFLSRAPWHGPPTTDQRQHHWATLDWELRRKGAKRNTGCLEADCRILSPWLKADWHSLHLLPSQSGAQNSDSSPQQAWSGAPRAYSQGPGSHDLLRKQPKDELRKQGQSLKGQRVSYSITIQLYQLLFTRCLLCLLISSKCYKYVIESNCFGRVYFLGSIP